MMLASPTLRRHHAKHQARPNNSPELTPGASVGWARSCHAGCLRSRKINRASNLLAAGIFSPGAAGMSSKVIQPAARSAIERSAQPTVNNFAGTRFATGDKNKPGRIALRRTRSGVAKPARLKLRAPVGAAARPPTSERTTPCEGPDTSTTRGRPTMPRKARMKNYAELTHSVLFR